MTSGLILAGGYSSRMGKNKAELPIKDSTFICHMVEKFRKIEIEDIIISGYELKGFTSVNDIYPHRGPMSGIHAGLNASKNDAVLVLAVDTPLVPESLLEELIIHHEKNKADITIVRHKGINEPLIGIYSKALLPLCEEILQGERTSMKELMKSSTVDFLDYEGDENLLMNFNTPEEYALLGSLI
ncbi:MAG: molybdenum cofactor guanylyltransferase [Clostridia bacterium]|nr:molybdenum cofactor guanylyltransferase [Clostridia bacterium]